MCPTRFRPLNATGRRGRRDSRGAGPIGLMAAALAQLHGAASVRVYEANPARVERARALGFDAGQPNESKADTTDVVFECAGAARAVAYSIKIARRGGRVVLVGVAAPETEVSFRPFEVLRQELTIQWAYKPVRNETRGPDSGGRPRPLASACDSRLSRWLSSRKPGTFTSAERASRFAFGRMTNFANSSPLFLSHESYPL